MLPNSYAMVALVRNAALYRGARLRFQVYPLVGNYSVLWLKPRLHFPIENVSRISDKRRSTFECRLQAMMIRECCFWQPI